MRWFCILLAYGALAQSVAPPPTTPVVPPATPALAPATAPATALSPREAMLASIEKQRAAMVVQRESVRKQGEMAAQWRAPTAETAETAETVEPACDPMVDTTVAPIIEGAAKAQSVDTKLLRAVIERESAFRPCAVSIKGAKGLMQLMPDTAQQFGVSDPFDPKENIEAGAKFLKQLIDKYKGDLSLTLAAYNAGPGTVDQTGKVPDIQETRDYIDAILKKIK